MLTLHEASARSFLSLKTSSSSSEQTSATVIGKIIHFENNNSMLTICTNCSTERRDVLKNRFSFNVMMYGIAV